MGLAWLGFWQMGADGGMVGGEIKTKGRWWVGPCH